MSELEEISGKLTGLTAGEILEFAIARFPGKVIFSSSFGLEDQVISHLIGSANLPIDVFSLDTGRLFPEVYSLMERTREKYHPNLKVYFPDAQSVEELVNSKGAFSFYESVENRKECCRIRKVEPLKRALKGYDCWITGIRAEQSDGRSEMSMVEWDEGNSILKFHPLLNWTFEEVKEFIRANHVPYNKLHDQGFVSIGCAPCTRAIKAGEDFRAGRWWWEDQSKKECGLHIHE